MQEKDDKGLRNTDMHMMHKMPAKLEENQDKDGNLMCGLGLRHKMGCLP
jgi:hypothetical protein